MFFAGRKGEGEGKMKREGEKRRVKRVKKRRRVKRRRRGRGEKKEGGGRERERERENRLWCKCYITKRLSEGMNRISTELSLKVNNDLLCIAHIVSLTHHITSKILSSKLRSQQTQLPLY